MIRGAIEVVTEERISGWIYSGAVLASGTLALAFCGSRCVGSGKISLFRQDIADAGLGDGYSGFDFNISLKPDEDVASIVIKLQLCDFALLQRTSIVTSQLGERPRRQGRLMQAAE